MLISFLVEKISIGEVAALVDVTFIVIDKTYKSQVLLTRGG